jgi:hypothetical protein
MHWPHSGGLYHREEVIDQGGQPVRTLAVDGDLRQAGITGVIGEDMVVGAQVGDGSPEYGVVIRVTVDEKYS